MMNTNKVTVFYACDDRYIPYLSVSLLSLTENADKATVYNVIILHSGVCKKNIDTICGMATDNVSVSFTDVSDQLRQIADQLCLRDYYSLSIYYRIFIPELFPETEKAIYLDSDTVVLSDIAKLYQTNLKDNLVAAVPDMVVASEEIFRKYADDGVGVPYKRYFNSGVMVMNLALMRKHRLQNQFTHLLETHHFNTICPDQDYLNVICKDKVLYLGTEWNKMSVDESPCIRLNLIHYNMFFKPWLYSGVLYQEYFWEYAKRSPFYENLLEEKKNFSEENLQQDIAAGEHLRKTAGQIIESNYNFKSVLTGETV